MIAAMGVLSWCITPPLFASISMEDEQIEQELSAMDEQATRRPSREPASPSNNEETPEHLLSTLNLVPLTQVTQDRSWFEKRAFEQEALAIEDLVDKKKLAEATRRLHALREKFPEVLALEYLAARIDLERGDVVPARDRLLILMRSVPDFQPARYLLAYVLISQGDVDRGRLVLNGLPADAPPTLTLRVLLAYKTHDYTIATQRFLIELSERLPNNAWLPFIHGLMTAEAGDRARAAALFEESLRREPHPPAFAYLAVVQMLLGERQTALDTVERARRAFPESPLPLIVKQHLLDPKDVEAMIANFQQLLAMVPDSTEFWIDYIRYLGSVQQLSKAEAAVAALEEQFPGASWIESVKGELAYQQGEAAYDRGDYAQAVVWHQMATQKRPEVPYTWYSLVYDYKEQQNYPEALATARILVERFPISAPAINLLGIILRHMGRVEEALEQHRRAITLDLRYGLAYAGVVDSLRRLNRLEEAIAFGKQALMTIPKEGELYWRLGNVYERTGELEQAEAMYQRCLEFLPTFDLALHDLAMVHRRLGDVKGSVHDAERAAALKPSDFTYQIDLVNAYLAAGRKAEGKVLLGQLAAKGSSSAWGNYKLGQAYRESGDWLQAIAFYRKALELKPDWSWVKNELGLAYRKANQPDEAEAIFQDIVSKDPAFVWAYHSLGVLYEKVHKDYTRALQFYQQAIEKNSEAAISYHAAANCLLALHRPAEAETSVRRALELEPDNQSFSYTYVRALADQGKQQEARAYIESLRNRLTPAVKALRIMGDLYMEVLDDFEPAKTIFLEGARQQPEESFWQRSLALGEYHQQHYDRSIQYSLKAIKLAPEDPAAHYNLGLTYRLAKDYAHAIEQLLRATELDPDGHPADNVSDLCWNYYDLKEYDKSLTCAQAFVRRNPDDLLGLRVLGNTLKSLNRCPEAVPILQHAVDVNGYGGWQAVTLAQCLETLGRVDDAIRIVRQSTQAAPTFRPAYRQLYNVLSRQGHRVEAAETIRSALQQFPGDREFEGFLKETGQ